MPLQETIFVSKLCILIKYFSCKTSLGWSDNNIAFTNLNVAIKIIWTKMTKFQLKMHK